MNLPEIRIIVGKTFSGKTTFVKKFSRNNQIISHTTRPLRYGEQNGVDYWFESTFNENKNVLAKRIYYAFDDKNQKQKWTYWIDKRDIKRFHSVVTDLAGALEIIKTGEYNVTLIYVDTSIATIRSRFQYSERNIENRRESERRLKSDIAMFESLDSVIQEIGVKTLFADKYAQCYIDSFGFKLVRIDENFSNENINSLLYDVAFEPTHYTVWFRTLFEVIE